MTFEFLDYHRAGPLGAIAKAASSPNAAFSTSGGPLSPLRESPTGRPLSPLAESPPPASPDPRPATGKSGTGVPRS